MLPEPWGCFAGGVGVVGVGVGVGSLPLAPRRYAMIIACWPGPLGKLPAVTIVSP